MWAAKLPGEGAALHDAAVAMSDVMIELGIAVDGGKDSLSMAALAPRADGSENDARGQAEPFPRLLLGGLRRGPEPHAAGVGHGATRPG